MSDTISLFTNGLVVQGWEDVRVTIALEQMPNSFQIEMTESYTPSGSTGFLDAVMAGEECVVQVGDDLLITGVIDEVNRSANQDSRSVQIFGRGKCRNLIDCNVPLTPLNLSGTPTVKDIAEHFCNLHNIAVVVKSDVALPTFPGVIWNVTDTPFSLLDQYAHVCGMVMYEDGSGNLVLARLSSLGKHASGFVEGVNVERMAAKESVAERYGTYNLMSPAFQPGPDGASRQTFTLTDPAIDPARTLNVVTSYWDQFSTNTPPLETAARFTMNRRVGRSSAVTVTCDSWRDASGTLWQIGYTATVNLPSMGVTNKNWMIGSVVFSRNNNSGTTAELVLMDPAAYAPELINTTVDQTLIDASK